jgi:hypothetical protein
MATWTHKVNGDIVDADHVNKLQDDKLDFDDTRLPYITPEMYGWRSTLNAIDSTAAIQVAIDEAGVTGRPLFLASPEFLLDGVGDALLTIHYPITMFGYNMLRTVFRVAAGVPNTTDIIVCSSTGNQEGLTLEEFSILPVSGTPGRHGIRFDVHDVGKSWSKVLINHLYVRSMAGRAIKVDNPHLDHDAFHTSNILCSVLSGGVQLLGAGDSINIRGNILNTASGAIAGGKEAGVEAQLISAADPGGIGSSSLLVVENNNITANGGAVWVRAGTRTKIIHNNVEIPGAPTGQPNKALIDIDGDATHILENVEVKGNLLGATSHNVNDTIRVNYAKNAILEDNTVEPSGGFWNNYPTDPATYDADWKGIRCTANSLYTEIRSQRWSYPAWNGSEDHRIASAGQAQLYQPKNSAAVAYSANVSFYMSDGEYFTVTVTDGNAFAILYPYVNVAASQFPAQAGCRLTIQIKNTSGGAMGVITWDVAYKMAAWANPADGYNKSISFVLMGSYWTEVSRTVDIPN